MVYVLENTKNLVILRCCFAERGYEIYKDLKRMCTAIILVIKPFVWRRFVAVAITVCLSSLNALGGCF